MDRLFDDDLTPVEHFSRLTDPGPSHDAADRQEPLGHNAMRVLATLVEIERTNPHRIGATAAEIQHRQAYDNERPLEKNCISRRLTSLVRHGLVVVAGERRDGGYGVEVSVYCATPSGRAALAAVA